MQFSLLDKGQVLILVDKRTGAAFGEFNISAAELTEMGTIDVPLDPENQPDYRANRDAQEDNNAYIKMVEDAEKGRTFRNIVCEYNTQTQPEKPLKIIGGQHRYLAIEQALALGINEYHGITVYFLLDKDQRLDVQLISNTNISVSADLLDRMFETSKGPELRSWCQAVALLQKNEDFADKKQRGSQISVRGARTFIVNYFKGLEIKDTEFDLLDTTPLLVRTGDVDTQWETIRARPNVWKNKGLLTAGKEFARLNKAVKQFYNGTRQMEFSEKALSYSVIAAWALVAGVLNKNSVRLKKHFELGLINGADPLASALLAKAKHKSDPDNYRGLGTRTDAKDRGRLAELFFLQAEKGGGIKQPLINAAMAKYHAKQAALEAMAAVKRI